MIRIETNLAEEIDAVRDWIDRIDEHEGEEDCPGGIPGCRLSLATLEARIAVRPENRLLSETKATDGICVEIAAITPMTGVPISAADLMKLTALVERLQRYADSLSPVPVGHPDPRD